MKEPLRLGVMIDGDVLPRWAVALLDDIAAAGDAQVVLVLVNETPNRRDVRELGDWFGTHRGASYRAWMALEYRLFRREAASFVATDLPKSFAHIPRLPVVPPDDETQSLTSDDLERLSAWELDVLLQLGFGALRGKVLGMPRFGVWRLRLGDAMHIPAGPPGFWEVLRQEGETRAVLEIVAPGDSGFLLAEGGFTSNDHSVLKNREGVYWSATRWIIRELSAVRRLGEAGYRERLAVRHAATREVQVQGRVILDDAIPDGIGVDESRDVAAAEPSATGAHDLAGAEPRFPTAAWQFLRTALLRPLQRRLRERLMLDQWVLMFAIAPDGADLSRPELSLREFRMIRPPLDRFWADPCVIAHDGHWWVFFEEFVYAKRKGVLACLEIFEDGTWSTPRRILELPCHLSYPFVFQHNGAFYMIPETGGQRSIDLYRAEEFPYRWTKHRTLIDDIEAVDATLIEHQGRWWLFANVVSGPYLTTQDELWLFSTDDPIEGKWLPHVGNPVVSDAMSARPAGRLWRERTANGDRLMRPSQNSAGHYGFALNIQEVLQLDDTDYRESCVIQVKPGWHRDIVGVHTLSFAGGLTTIDAVVRHSKFSRGGPLK